MSQSTLLDNAYFGPGFKDIARYIVGLDEYANRLSRASSMSKSGGNFPPYNLIQVNENQYRIEMAVAGFTQDDISVEIKEGHLNIIGKHDSESQDQNLTEEYIHKGIAHRTFNRSFVLGEHVEVTDCHLRHGMLIIQLERVIPEYMKPKQIKVK
jgi:molecular chaperone IbpA